MQRRSVRGTTMVEAMMALAVFTVGVLGVLQMNVLASAQNSVARRQSTGSALARDVVDAFERIPYDHPALALSSLAVSAPGFDEPENPTGLHRLTDSHAGARPLEGVAAMLAETAEANLYSVSWRVAPEPLAAAPGSEQAKRVVVMVRVRMPVGGYKTLKLWTVKYNPTAVVGASTVQEI